MRQDIKENKKIVDAFKKAPTSNKGFATVKVDGEKVHVGKGVSSNRNIAKSQSEMKARYSKSEDEGKNVLRGTRTEVIYMGQDDEGYWEVYSRVHDIPALQEAYK